MAFLRRVKESKSPFTVTVHLTLILVQCFSYCYLSSYLHTTTIFVCLVLRGSTKDFISVLTGKLRSVEPRLGQLDHKWGHTAELVQLLAFGRPVVTQHVGLNKLVLYSTIAAGVLTFFPLSVHPGSRWSRAKNQTLLLQLQAFNTHSDILLPP